jgi:hypothetical protein
MQQTMIVSSNRRPWMDVASEDTVVVATPLDAITQLEKGRRIRTVVLAGKYARSPELTAFLHEFYPAIHVELVV